VKFLFVTVFLALAALALGAASGMSGSPADEAEPPFDLLITGGQVVDGTGSPSYVADVGILKGRIVAVGKLAGRPARRTIDARGLIVAPGFIDMLGQSEITLLVDGRAESKIRLRPRARPRHL
jgi:N-acyl-D-amino-acid deacylase